MLNVSKIHSLITKGENNPSVVSRGTGINYRTLKSKIESDSWTANDVEILAEFFKKPIAYFFDKEETKVLTEPDEKYRIKMIHCTECISKQKEIDALKLALDAKDELLDIYREKKGQDCV